jgi:hypothetical protein
VIVFDLKCAGAGHVFEAWFGSSSAYEDQQARGLLACPLCGDTDVSKAVMAAAVPAKANQRGGASVPVSNGPDPAAMRAMIEKLAGAQAEALKESQWVGRQFADTARAMHYGEQDHKNIHGEVAPAEAKALIEEGVKVAPLPFPVVPPKAQN